MNNKIFILLLTGLFLLTACESVQIDELSDEDLQRVSEYLVVCEKPYMRYASSCCLDANENTICDEDETQEGLDVKTTTPEEEMKPPLSIPEGDTVESFCGDQACDKGEDCSSCEQDCGCEEESICSTYELDGVDKWGCKSLKVLPQFTKLWIGSRTGIAAANPLPGQEGEIVYFYLWYENRGETTFNCDTKEYYDGQENEVNDEFTVTVRAGQNESVRIMIEPDETLTYRTIIYEATCYNLGEKEVDNSHTKTTWIAIDYYDQT